LLSTVGGAHKELAVPDSVEVQSEGGTLTQEQVDELVKERLAAAKAEQDKAFKSLWAEAKAAKEELKSYAGIDADEYKRLKSEAEEAERQKAEAEGDFKKLEDQLIERHKAQLAEKDVKLGKYQKAIEKRLVQAELTKAIAAAKGDPDLLLPHAERYVRVRETDDDFVAFVVGEDGKQLFSDGQGTPMTFDSLVSDKLLPKYPRAFDGTGSSGGGAPKTTGGASSVRVKTIAAGDNAAFLANLDGIASGAVTVAD